MKSTKIFLLALAFPMSAYSAALVSTVTATGFDVGGAALSGTPTNGLAVYDAGGVLQGSWVVALGSFSSSATVAAGNGSAFSGTTSINTSGTFNYNEDSSGVDAPGDSTFTNPNTFFPSRGVITSSLDAGAISADSIIITSEDLTMSHTFSLLEVNFMQNSGNAGPYGHTFNGNFAQRTGATFGSAINAAEILGNSAIYNETEANWTADNLMGSMLNATGNVSVGASTSTFSITTGAAGDGVTGTYDGSGLTLMTQRQLFSRIDTVIDNTGITDLPSIQFTDNSSVTGGYTANYTEFTFVPVPEPTSSALLGLGALGLITRRKR